MPRGDDFGVNFLTLGAQKSGTTALAHFLSQHEDICVAPAKEVHLFDYPDWPWMDWSGKNVNRRYRPHFPNYCGERWVGEATPEYLYLPWVPGLLHHYNPELKLIVLLREPGARALSHFHHEQREGRASLPFALELGREAYRCCKYGRRRRYPIAARQSAYVGRGRYLPQLRRLLRFFDRSRILVLTSDALARDHERTLMAVNEFLELQPPGASGSESAIPRAERLNASPPTALRFGEIVTKRAVSRWCARDRPLLERMLGIDLTSWGGDSSAPATAPDAIEHGLSLERKIAHLFAEVLGKARVHEDDDFFQLGGGTGQVALLEDRSLRRLEERIRLPVLARHPSPRLLAAYFEGRRAESSPPSRAVVFALAGADELSRGAHLRTPARGDIRIEILPPGTAPPVERLRAIQPEGPWHILGAGSQSLAAFELAQSLASQGKSSVALLALLDPADPPERFEAPFPGDIVLVLAGNGNPPPIADRRLDWALGATRGVRVVTLPCLTGGLDAPEQAHGVISALARLVGGAPLGASLEHYRETAAPRIIALDSSREAVRTHDGPVLPLSGEKPTRGGAIHEVARASDLLCVSGVATDPDTGGPAGVIGVFLGNELALLDANRRTGDPERDKRFELEVELNHLGRTAEGGVRVLVAGTKSLVELSAQNSNGGSQS